MFPISLSSKRARLALRFFTYGVMTLTTVVLTTVAIFYALGYRFDDDTLRFVQGGLVQFNSVPGGAAVVIDGKVQGFKTPGRANLSAGSHTITMQLDGYRGWQKTVSLEPGQLLWVNYTRLIPDSVTTVPLRSFATVSGMMASPNRRWIIIQEKADRSVLTLADTNDERNVTYADITIPDAQLTRVNNALGQLKLVEWDLDSRFFLVHHTGAQINEWLRVDRTQPNQAINLTRLFRLPIADAHFAGSNPNLVYAKTDDVLRRFDIGAGSASAALVSGVQQFVLYGDDTVAFVAEREATPGTPASKQQIIGLYQGGKETDIQTHPVGPALKIAFGKYDNHSYLAIHKGNGQIQILRDPTVAAVKDTAQFALFDIGKPAAQMMFSNNGRMVVAGTDNLITTYDLELGTTYSSLLSFLGEKPVRPLNWLDDFYLWSDAGDRLRIVEFDGQNDREITTVSGGFSVSLSSTGKTLFSIGKNAITNSHFLQASQLEKR